MTFKRHAGNKNKINYNLEDGKMKRQITLVILLFAAFQSISEAVIVYDDGDIHNISTQTGDNVAVLNRYSDDSATTMPLNMKLLI